MSLNNLILPDIVIAALFKNNLLAIDIQPVRAVYEQEKVQAGKSIPYLGEYLKRTIVFVNYPQEVYLPEAPLHFLANILKACNLTIADIAIINLAKITCSLEQLQEQFSPVKVIFFNTSPADIFIDCSLPEFSIKNHRKLSLLKAPALDQLNQQNEDGKLLKSKLWFCLKDFFSVSSPA